MLHHELANPPVRLTPSPFMILPSLADPAPQICQLPVHSRRESSHRQTVGRDNGGVQL